MFIKNVRIFIKQLLRNRVFSFITIAGFSIALMFVILLSIYVQGELSIDSFHEHKDRVYRLTTEKYSSFAPPIGGMIMDTNPEVESYTRVYTQSDVISDVNRQTLRFEFLMVDPAFLEMFSFSMVEGNKAEALASKNSIVLSQSFAKKMFGSESPVGKEVELSQRHKFIVSGVIEDFGGETHFKYCDALVNFTYLADLWGWDEVLTSLGNSSFALYLMAKPHADLVAKESAILEQFKKDYWMYQGGYASEVHMEPLKEVYFGEKQGSGAKTNSKRFILILSTISIVILLIAIINYINLSVAQSSFRSREVAVKKLLGSSSLRIILQFVIESILICILAFNIALIMAKLAEPLFNSLLNTHISIQGYFTFSKTAAYLLLIMLVGAISGLAPAFIMSQFAAIDVVKGFFRKRSKGTYSRLLIGLQYCSAIVLIICACTIVRQTNYLKNYDVGFNKNGILWINNDVSSQKKGALREEFLKIDGVEDVSFVAGSPIDGGNNQSFVYNEKPVSFQEFKVDSAFFNMFGIASRPTGMAYQRGVFWLNETAIRELELDSIPQTFEFSGNNVPIYGVLSDFHFKDLHQKMGPAIVHLLPEDAYPWTIFVKLANGNPTGTISKLGDVYCKFTNGLPMDYGFVDETIEKWYHEEERNAKLIGYFSMLAIVISVMGIFGMAGFYIIQREKEVGIRKTFGASDIQVMGMFNWNFIKWVLVAFVAAIPIAYYAMDSWLQSFPYRIELSWWIFATSGVVVIAIALVTVSWLSYKISTSNPVEALRYE
jgi:putative ABC transport system permease protein